MKLPQIKKKHDSLTPSPGVLGEIKPPFKKDLSNEITTIHSKRLTCNTQTRKGFQIIIPPKQTFMARLQRAEPAARDATALNIWNTCSRKYFYEIVLSFRIPKMGQPIYLAFGSCYHKFREVLEVIYQETNDIPSSLEKAWKATEEEWPGDPNLDPKNKWSYLTKDYLLLSCMTGFNWWRKEKEKEDIVVIATEQAFEVMLGDTDKTSGGRADQVVRWNVRIWGRDFKTTSMAPEWFQKTQLEPKDQFTRYTHGESGITGSKVEGQIVEVLFHKKATKTDSGKPFIKRFIVQHTDSQIKRWLEEQILLEKQIDLAREADIWPQQTYNCGRCPYIKVCQMATERGMMAKLEQLFKSEPWNYKEIVND